MAQPPPPSLAFLQEFLAPALIVEHDDRPHVTLTYAQSLDAKIAGVSGKQLRISGKESMEMTHWMRTVHDAILVGIGTALNDDPQLNARHLPPRADGLPYPLPTPVVLDSALRFKTTSKLLANYSSGVGRQPWIFTSRNVDTERKSALLASGAKHTSVDEIDDGKLDLLSVLKNLKEVGIKSLMVEGGQRIISSLLSLSPPVVDIVVVTIAPMFVGSDGTGVTEANQENTLTLQHLHSITLGHDTVVACKVV